MLVDRPAVFNVFPFMFRRGINVLQEGVTYRFLGSIKELKSRSLMLKGALKTRNRDIITRVEYDDEYLEKIAKEKKVVVVNKKTATTKSSETKKTEEAEVKPAVKKVTVRNVFRHKKRFLMTIIGVAGCTGLIIAGLSWLVLSLFGCLPFIISQDIPNFFDAFFEIVSGFTTTGASDVPDVTALHHSIIGSFSFHSDDYTRK